MNFFTKNPNRKYKKKKKNWVGAGGWSKCIFSYGFKFEIKKNLFFWGGGDGEGTGDGGRGRRGRGARVSELLLQRIQI